jgi:methyl-accepting chemotaxis protein
MKSMTVAMRLWMMVAIAVISLIVVGIAGVVATRDLSSKLREVNEKSIPALDALMSVQNSLSLMQGQLLLHLTYYEPEQTLEMDKRIEEARAALKTSFEAYAALSPDAAATALFDADKAAYADYESAFMKAWEQAKENSKLVAREIIVTESTPKAKVVSDAIAKHIAFAKEQADAARVVAEAESQRMTTIAWSLIAAGVALVLTLAYLLIRRIGGQLLMMRDSIREVETSMDFTQRIAIDTQDELGSTARAFNRLMVKLQESFRTLADCAATVLVSSDALSNTAAQVAGSAESQSDAASNMAASVEQLTVSIAHVGDRTAESDLVFKESGKLAQEGTQVIGQTVQDIRDIEGVVAVSSERIRQLDEQTKKIFSLMSVIDDIANQTRLLALNAAIEAARAGEQGRGFAVVADEVRKLADMTTKSTKEISDTIDTMRASAGQAVDSMEVAVNRVSIGVARANDASQAIQKIGATSAQAVSLASEIASAVNEQRHASSQIAQMIETIAQQAEESSAAAQSGAAQARQLDTQAQTMQHTVAAYRV